jgi:hypothetical protein
MAHRPNFAQRTPDLTEKQFLQTMLVLCESQAINHSRAINCVIANSDVLVNRSTLDAWGALLGHEPDELLRRFLYLLAAEQQRE